MIWNNLNIFHEQTRHVITIRLRFLQFNVDCVNIKIRPGRQNDYKVCSAFAANSVFIKKKYHQQTKIKILKNSCRFCWIRKNAESVTVIEKKVCCECVWATVIVELNNWIIIFWSRTYILTNHALLVHWGWITFLVFSCLNPSSLLHSKVLIEALSFLPI